MEGEEEGKLTTIQLAASGDSRLFTCALHNVRFAVLFAVYARTVSTRNTLTTGGSGRALGAAGYRQMALPPKHRLFGPAAQLYVFRTRSCHRCNWVLLVEFSLSC